jgi:hypothetical protein
MVKKKKKRHGISLIIGDIPFTHTRATDDALYSNF